MLGAAIGFCIGVSALLIVKSSFPKPEDPLAGWKKPEWVENDGNKKAFRGWIMNLGMLSSSSILGGIAGTRVSETLKRKQR